MEVTAVIPAYNEEERIGKVLEAVKASSKVNRIIVIDDGSDDRTAQTAQDMGAEVIKNNHNMGKGGALHKGFRECTSEIILFLDADLIGLKSVHVDQLIEPVLAGECDMSVGIFENGRFATDLAQKVAPFLSGQRAIRREILMDVSGLEISRYGVETALTRYVHKNNIKIKEVLLPDVSHVMKEEKLGFVRGFAERLRMYWDIVRALRS